MIILGLDGLSYEALNYFEAWLPILTHYRHSQNSTEIEITGIPHSGPSWTTIFTGKHWTEHGIYGFKNRQTNDFFTDEDFKYTFLWEALQARGLKVKTINVPARIPPINFNSDFKPHFNVEGLKITGNDLVADLAAMEAEILASLPYYDVIIAVTVALDKAHHLSHQFCHHNLDGALYAYKAVDTFVENIWSKCCNSQKSDTVIISDHGLPAKAFYHPDGFTIPAHQPYGVLMTSVSPDFMHLRGTALPTQSIQIFDWLLKLNYVNPGNIKKERHTNEEGLTVEEKKLLEKHLAQLGYIE